MFSLNLACAVKEHWSELHTKKKGSKFPNWLHHVYKIPFQWYRTKPVFLKSFRKKKFLSSGRSIIHFPLVLLLSEETFWGKKCLPMKRMWGNWGDERQVRWDFLIFFNLGINVCPLGNYLWISPELSLQRIWTDTSKVGVTFEYRCLV